jgi:hypothetical protein
MVINHDYIGRGCRAVRRAPAPAGGMNPLVTPLPRDAWPLRDADAQGQIG